MKEKLSEAKNKFETDLKKTIDEKDNLLNDQLDKIEDLEK